MVLSFFIAAFIYYPVIKLYFWPEKVHVTPGQPTISIPKIEAYAPLILNVDPWDKYEYEEALKKGVAHAKGTSIPGENNISYLFAHSSALPWEITRYNTVFLRLNELQQGDEIRITNEGNEFVFTVVRKKIVSARDVSFLAQQNNTILIIQTCWPIGTDWQRLLVFAEPV